MISDQALTCENLDKAIEQYKLLGYRLDMIFPADSPREALVSMDSGSVRLLQNPARSKGTCDDTESPYCGRVSASEWILGRAGMEYRDLIPGRLNGKVIASNIRLTKGGKVPDYVHYHKVDLQMIYCKRGRIRVVYEDQGPPFWLETGDCVLQPPEVRHRVLECTSGAEVVEVGVPAEHETWVEHEIELPTPELKFDREYGVQRFVRHQSVDAGDGERDTGIGTATNGHADLKIVRERGRDVLLLLTLRGFGSEGNGPLTAPISLEIPI